MADRDKQEAYETLAIMSMYALARFDDAQRRNDAAALADLRQMAVSHITETVGPMDSIMLTRDGLMYR
jgi:hypothetical protein